jgi:hypothetical protein
MAHPSSRRFDWIVTGLAALLPVVVFHEAATSLAEQDAASGGPMRDAALFPEVVAWILIVPIAANALRLARARRPPDPGNFGPGNFGPGNGGPGNGGPGNGGPGNGGDDVGEAPLTGLALLSTGLFVTYLLALPLLGYYVATPVLLVVLTRLYGAPWLAALTASLGLTLAVALVFEGFLDVVLPLGPSGFTLFG